MFAADPAALPANDSTPTRQQIAALRDFSPLDVRFGSYPTKIVEAARSCMSALFPKADK
jgi:hypothetical protein